MYSMARGITTGTVSLLREGAKWNHDSALREKPCCDNTWFTNSCGQGYTRMSTFGAPKINPRQRNGTGAHFIVGKHGEEVDNDEEKLTHVKTSNGYITVHILKKR